ncbi:MAG: inositol monophosphatase family protein [Candidatus Algichlamydia australiensis]|nr:inositol monophosphatase family protein [Chlamydiales bacterium]
METPLNIPGSLVSRLSNVATLAALRAGEILKKGFGSSFEISSKSGKHNLVTEYDMLAEELIVAFIRKTFPEHNFLAEEGGLSGSRKDVITWVIDPLDGTVNFAHNIPIFAVSIAAVFEGSVLSAAIYNPMVGELFTAEKGNGAYLNGSKLKVTETETLSDCIAATGFPYNTYENPLHCIDHFTYMAKLGIPLRRIGSAAIDLAYMAAGRVDCFWEVSLRPWDYAAGMLLIEEAGGVVTDFLGKRYEEIIEGPILASNGRVHNQLIEHFKTTYEDS